jgi:hypothetical protein
MNQFNSGTTTNHEAIGEHDKTKSHARKQPETAKAVAARLRKSDTHGDRMAGGPGVLTRPLTCCRACEEARLIGNWRGKLRSHNLVSSPTKHQMRTPENVLSDVGVISEEEDEEGEPIRRLTRAYWSRNWLRQIPWLTQTGVNGKKRPPVGRLC